MLKRAKLHIIFYLCMFILSGCSDFFDQEPDDSIPSGKAMQTVADAQVALNGTYRLMTDINYYGRRFLFYADMKGGDFFTPSLGRGDHELFTFTHEENISSYVTYWDIIYKVLLQTNQIIQSISSGKVKVISENEQTTLNDIYGQALSIRALCHFDLVRLYGYPYLKDNGASWGAAIVTRPLNSKEQPDRNTVAETYEQVIQDLNNAIPLLKNSKNNGYFNQFAAKALLSRVYLYHGDWQNAYETALDVIENSACTPYTNEEWASSWKSAFGSESLLELFINPSENDLAASSPTYFLRPREVTSGALGATVAGNHFLNSLSEDPDDVRWTVMGEDEYAIKNTIPGRRGRVLKYEGDGKSLTTATNIKLIRISEIYLIGAEAALKKEEQDLEKVTEWLNVIKRRSPNLPPATKNDTNLEKQILEEKRKELFAEGHRYFDCMRLGKTIIFDEAIFGEPVIPPNGRSTSVDWNYYKCVLPIPLEEILANPSIEVQQNPGY